MISRMQRRVSALEDYSSSDPFQVIVILPGQPAPVAADPNQKVRILRIVGVTAKDAA